MAAADTACVIKLVLSTYVSSPADQSRQWYIDKTASIGTIDPYVIPPNQFSEKDELLPPLTYPDLYTYLVITRSAYTNEQMKPYKELQASTLSADG